MRRLALPLAFVLVAAAGLWLWRDIATRPAPEAALTPPPELVNIVLPRPKALKPFRLVDMNGKAFGPERFLGHWTFLFFGYTHCPDVCPTTLAMLHQTHRRLAAILPGAVKDINYMFVSVDPRRDSPEGLKTYVHYFDKAFVGATGADQRAVNRITHQLGIVYVFVGDTKGTDYSVNHSSTLLLMDPKGQLFARFNPPFAPDKLAAEFVKVRAFYDSLKS